MTGRRPPTPSPSRHSCHGSYAVRRSSGLPEVRAIALGIVAAALAAACGSTPPPHEGPLLPRDAAEPPPGGASGFGRCPEPVASSVSRAALLEFLDRGIPDLLARVFVDPVLDRPGEGARFVGYRVVSMTDDVRCGPGGIREGDIVVAVNGTSVGHPDDVERVWSSLAWATTIVVSLIRGGRTLDVSVAVEDVSPPESPPAGPERPE